MKRSIVIFFLALFVAMPYFGCQKPKTYPDIPAIEFVSLSKQRYVTGLDSTTIITISFTDGDGDVGLTSADTLNPYNPGSVYYNDFIVSLFTKTNGVWVQDTIHVPPKFPGFSGRLPDLTPTGTNKALSGDISMTQYLLGSGLNNDTIYYEVYIYDRALHKSNTITTSEIVVNAP